MTSAYSAWPNVLLFVNHSFFFITAFFSRKFFSFGFPASESISREKRDSKVWPPAQSAASSGRRRLRKARPIQKVITLGGCPHLVEIERSKKEAKIQRSPIRLGCRDGFRGEFRLRKAQRPMVLQQGRRGHRHAVRQGWAPRPQGGLVSAASGQLHPRHGTTSKSVRKPWLDTTLGS